MSLIYTINGYLNRYPFVKKGIKRAVQRTMVSLMHNFRSEGDIHRLSPMDDDHEYFFGYYDKSPWDITGRYVLCLRAVNTWDCVAPSEPAEIIRIDTNNNNSIEVLGKTRSWNVQQGCMLQWLGPDYERYIIYNDFRDGKYCSVVLDLHSREERVLCFPVYSVAQDGSFALSLDFSRLHRLRPGYGYSNMEDRTKKEFIPDGTCIWKLNILTNTLESVLRYTDFTQFEPRKEMEDAVHKVNHIMVSPNGRRFMVLHRWFCGERKYSRLVTANIDGTSLYNLSDDDMVSHCCWKNDNEILAFENKHESGIGYYLMMDRTDMYQRYWSNINYDGHPSYSPDGSAILFDRYPDIRRIAAVMVADSSLTEGHTVRVLARVFAPFRYDNDTRCDLHPRWSRDGRQICFDAVFEGHRGLYAVPYK
ncbi:TolB family protein [Selenomonas sputigena]|uniref:TolB family protein n=1 Tax=Selenomonas sputigena TaxID=69823 RepID=UPI002230CA68|nr:hypothetical protein [Selenomonas sputigena]UZD42490.1 hypothetical protein OL240_08035 [Selenomonas sputigena]